MGGGRRRTAVLWIFAVLVAAAAAYLTAIVAVVVTTTTSGDFDRRSVRHAVPRVHPRHSFGGTERLLFSGAGSTFTASQDALAEYLDTDEAQDDYFDDVMADLTTKALHAAQQSSEEGGRWLGVSGPQGSWDIVAIVEAGLPFRCVSGEVWVDLVKFEEASTRYKGWGTLDVDVTFDKIAIHSRGGVNRLIPKLDEPGYFVLPLTPTWHGLAANTVIYLTSLWLALPWRAWRRHCRRQVGKCPKCKYDLRGNLVAGCPECGWGRGNTGCEGDAGEATS